MRQLGLYTLLVAILFLGCRSTAPKTEKILSGRPPGRALTEAQAQGRAALVTNVAYDLDLDLFRSKESFSGISRISFDLSRVEDLTLDFQGGELELFLVNGQSLETSSYNGDFLELKGAVLKVGTNSIVIHYKHSYSKNSAGLYRFNDSEDGASYIYTHFEPYDANAMFPCFDQPDLKARFTLKVTAPEVWQVISTTRESRREKTEGGAREWVFPESERISTYVFSLYAGDYQVWEDSYQGGGRKIPLRIFSRKSLAKYVRPSDWFTFSKQGMAFFESYFKTPYPYKKYDQILVPDFNAGAMENVAAVSFAESFVSRGLYTRVQRESLASVLLHEMSHMWFGDLVTMKWWNDLWLNESFATYISYKALVQATEFRDAWIRFFAEKGGAYWYDNLVVTHPIEDQVPSTDRAFSNFDPITYGKGASLLKQLNFSLGEEVFREGLRQYFSKYAGKNTTRKDFVDSMAEAAGKNYDDWTTKWLQTAGFNTVEVQWTCDGDDLKSVVVKQAAPEKYPVIRPHKFKIGFFKADKQGLTLTRAETFEMSGYEREMPLTKEADCPDFVFPNYGDHAYFRIRLDEKSLGLVQREPQRLKDPHLRVMVLETLWNMVRESEMSVISFSEMALKLLESEKEERVLDQLMTRLIGGGGRYLTVPYLLARRGNGGSSFEEYNTNIESILLRRLKVAVKGSDLQKKLFEWYVGAAQTPMALSRLKALLEGKDSFPGLTIDQDQRWGLLCRIAEMDPQGAVDLITAESSKDTSDRGRKGKLACLARRPSPEVKNQNWAYLLDPKNPLGDTKIVARSLFPRGQESLRASYADRFYVEMLKANAERDHYFADELARQLAPATCEKPGNDRLREFLDENEVLHESVKKNLTINWQEDSRCLSVRVL